MGAGSQQAVGDKLAWGTVPERGGPAVRIAFAWEEYSAVEGSEPWLLGHQEVTVARKTRS